MMKVKDRWWFKWLLVGLLLRFLLMPLTLHPDLWGQSITSYFFSHKGIVNVYEYYFSVPEGSDLAMNFSVRYLYIYPPLMYFTQGILNLLIRPFVNSSFIPSLISNPGEIMDFVGVHFQIFLLKLPYLFVDLFAGFLLAGLFEGKKKVKAFAAWMLNPLALYATFMMGQNDVIPVLFTILSVYFLLRKRFALSMILLGLGGSYKLYPLLFVIPLALALSNRNKERLKYIVLGLIPYLVTSGPFFFSRAYRQLVLLNPESTKMLHMGLPVSGAEFVYPFIALLVIIYFHAYKHVRPVNINRYFLAILLVLYSVTHFHPQWFLWITPFVIIELVNNKHKLGLEFFFVFLSWLVITLMFEPSLSFAMFFPLFPNLSQAVGLSEVASRFFDSYIVKSVFRSVLAGASMFIIWDLFKKPSKSL